MNLATGRNKLVFKDRLFVGLHFVLRALLPLVVFLTIAFLELPVLAYGLVLLAKWRIVATKPRFWWINLQSHLLDLVFSISTVYFMSWPSLSLWQQALWLAIYLAWIFGLKGLASWQGSLVRGLIVQGLGVALLIYALNQIPLPLVLIGIWLVSLIAARHILNGLPRTHYHRSLMQIWSLFALQLAWVLLHWQINFWVIPRLAFLLVIILLASSLLYILYTHQRLPAFLRRQIIASTLIIVFVVLFLSSIHTLSI